MTPTQFVDEIIHRYRETREELERTYESSIVMGYRDMYGYVMESRHEITRSQPVEKYNNSLLFHSTFQIQKQLWWMQFDFLHARYEDVRRNMRFLWELFLRDDCADNYARLNPNDSKAPNANDPDAKIQWIEENRRELSWKKLFAKVYDELKAADIQIPPLEYYQIIWERLNESCHPTYAWRMSTIQESTRFAFDHFDADMAHQCHEDANDIFGMYAQLLNLRFPHKRPDQEVKPHDSHETRNA